MRPMPTPADPKDLLRSLVAEEGGQAAFARKINVSQQLVWSWLNKSRRISAESAVKIEKATGVPRSRLRPDIFEAA